MTGLADLLVECDARDIRLFPAGDTELTIEAPEGELTADLIERLKAHKADLLAMLGTSPEVAQGQPVATCDAPAKRTKPVCRCGSTTWRDVPIHGGRC